MAALFAVAMLYGSTCTTLCAAGSCPLLGQSAGADQCHESPLHPCHSRHGMPEHSDCSTHGHPNVFINAQGPFQQQLTCVGCLSVNSAAAPVSGPVLGTRTNLWGADLAPPPILKNPLYQQFSVLRI